MVPGIYRDTKSTEAAVADQSTTTATAAEIAEPLDRARISSIHIVDSSFPGDLRGRILSPATGKSSKHFFNVLYRSNSYNGVCSVSGGAGGSGAQQVN